MNPDFLRKISFLRIYREVQYIFGQNAQNNGTEQQKKTGRVFFSTSGDIRAPSSKIAPAARSHVVRRKSLWKIFYWQTTLSGSICKNNMFPEIWTILALMTWPLLDNFSIQNSFYQLFFSGLFRLETYKTGNQYLWTKLDWFRQLRSIYHHSGSSIVYFALGFPHSIIIHRFHDEYQWVLLVRCLL